MFILEIHNPRKATPNYVTYGHDKGDILWYISASKPNVIVTDIAVDSGVMHGETPDTSGIFSEKNVFSGRYDVNKKIVTITPFNLESYKLTPNVIKTLKKKFNKADRFIYFGYEHEVSDKIPYIVKEEKSMNNSYLILEKIANHVNKTTKIIDYKTALGMIKKSIGDHEFDSSYVQTLQAGVSFSGKLNGKIFTIQRLKNDNSKYELILNENIQKDIMVGRRPATHETFELTNYHDTKYSGKETFVLISIPLYDKNENSIAHIKTYIGSRIPTTERMTVKQARALWDSLLKKGYKFNRKFYDIVESEQNRKDMWSVEPIEPERIQGIKQPITKYGVVLKKTGLGLNDRYKWATHKDGPIKFDSEKKAQEFADKLNKKNLHEVSPPSGPARRFAHDHPEIKRDFKRRYGNDWKSVFYGTAWKMFKRLKKKKMTESDSPISQSTSSVMGANSNIGKKTALVRMLKKKKTKKHLAADLVGVSGE